MSEDAFVVLDIIHYKYLLVFAKYLYKLQIPIHNHCTSIVELPITLHADEDEDDGTFRILQFPLVTMVIEINAMGTPFHCFGM